MKAWGLYSARVDTYSAPELIELFADEATAERVKAELFGKQRGRSYGGLWEDDEDFPDLYVRPVVVR